MDRVKRGSFGWVMYWVGCALSFGMFAADIDLTPLDMFFAAVLSLTSWVGVGANIVELFQGLCNGL